MRIDKALENIRAVMESQEIEWLNNNGYDPVPHKPEPRRPSAPKKALSGHFAANRFLGTAPTEPLELEEPEETAAPEEAVEFTKPEEAGEFTEHEESDAVIQTPAPEPAEPEADTEPEIIEVIKQKDNRHSWLYNEVVKAIRDASGDGKNTKVIAIFVPVIQNGKEFEDLPVSESIELPPVDEEAVKIEVLPGLEEEPPLPPEAQQESAEEPETEPAENVEDLLPESVSEPDAELAQAFIDIEAKLEEESENDSPEESEAPAGEELPAPEQETFPESEETPEPEELPASEEVPESEPEEEPEIEGLPDFGADSELEEVPLTEIIPTDDSESADDAAMEESAEFPDAAADVEVSAGFPEITADVEESPDEFSAGEAMEFTEIPLPDELDDEEVLDEIDENKN